MEAMEATRGRIAMRATPTDDSCATVGRHAKRPGASRTDFCARHSAHPSVPRDGSTISGSSKTLT